MSNNQAIERSNGGGQITRAQHLTKLFERSANKLAQVAPKHITPERMVRLLAASLSRVPKLADCDEGSLLVSLMTATQLGLEPNTPLGHGYIIPVWNTKRGCNEAQFWPGYRGLVHLAEQTGVIRGMRSRIVRARDVFEYEDTHKGEVWRFVPWDGEGDRGDLKKVFAVAERAEGFKPSIEVMRRDEIIAIRDASPSARNPRGLSGPWVTHFDEMARKTAIKRLAKQIPLATEADTMDPERPLERPADRFVRALNVERDTDETIDAMLTEHASRPAELGPAPNIPAADPNAKPVAESSSTPAATTTAPSDASKEGKAAKKTRAEGAKEKAAAAKPKDAPAAPPPEPVAEEKPAAVEPSSSSSSSEVFEGTVDPAEGATHDAPPDDDESESAEDGAMFPPPDDAPPPPPAPEPAASVVDTELAKLAAAKTVPELRAWYDSIMPRWDQLEQTARKPIMAAYRAKSAELSGK